jgi:hypothetical protein
VRQLSLKGHCRRIGRDRNIAEFHIAKNENWNHKKRKNHTCQEFNHQYPFTKPLAVLSFTFQQLMIG